MGNGAPVASQSLLNRQYDYTTVERLARKGYFMSNFEEYKRAIEESVRMNELDVLEVLIPAGNTKMALPLHIAASMGNIEACELLLSAGFGFLQSDNDGRTPLHLCAMHGTGSVDAAVCITLLGLQGNNAANIRDRQGCTPLHCAISSNNVDAVRWLLDSKGINVKLANGDGLTARDLARKKGYKHILELLDVKEGFLRPESSQVMTDINAKSKANPGYSEAVDQERIMRVWEAFFENAYKHMEAETSAVGGLMVDEGGLRHVQKNVKSQYYSSFDAGDSDDDDMYFHTRPPQGGLKRIDQQSTASASITARAKHKTPIKSISDAKSTISENQSSSSSNLRTTTYQNQSITPERVLAKAAVADPSIVKQAAGWKIHEVDPGVLAWYQNICCFESSNNSLYVININDQDNNNSSSMWLEEHLAYHEYWYGLIPSAWLTDVDAYLSLPTDCTLSVRCGWITYYDHTTNECCWYNIPSKHSLSCLPLGYDPFCDSIDGQELGLVSYEGSHEWRMCPHAWKLRHSWIAVMIEEDTHSKTTTATSAEATQYYFLNQITGFTSWYAPEGWDEMIRDHWGGWILCMSEGSDWAMFWYNPSSHESVWVET